MEFVSWTEERWFEFLEYLNREYQIATENYDGVFRLEVELSDGSVLIGEGDTVKEALLDFAFGFTEEYSCVKE